ncbi:MAG: hypothetical protein WC711_03000 [Candidatus Staskawiczbacteria bacterium]|jgi:hypothetical protein
MKTKKIIASTLMVLGIYIVVNAIAGNTCHQVVPFGNSCSAPWIIFFFGLPIIVASVIFLLSLVGGSMYFAGILMLYMGYINSIYNMRLDFLGNAFFISIAIALLGVGILYGIYDFFKSKSKK